MSYLSVTLALLLAAGVRAQNPQVTLPDLGTLEGYMGASYISERPFFHFRGVPFAQPPINELRFKGPQPVQPWTGVLDAHTSFGHRCPQLGPTGFYDDWQTNIESKAFSKAEEDNKEDCLFLQIYSPNIDTAANLPVLVFLHGGAFTSGSSRLYGGNKFMDHDLVLVVPHYRLGPLGFLSLHNDDIPGNAGLLDQVEALRWIQKYISYFGGDPNRVTVMGESAGAISASMLNLSPLSTNLFQQYILQSGAAIANWGIDADPIRAATTIGVYAGCNNTEISALTRCLLAVDHHSLNTAFANFRSVEMSAGRTGFAGSSPIVQIAGAQRFLERTPRDMFATGDYNAKTAMFGSNKHDGSMIYAFFYEYFLVPHNLTHHEQFLSRDITKYLLGHQGAQDQGDTLAIAVENTYLGKANMGNLTAMVPGIIDFTGDLSFKGPVYQSVEYNSAKGATSYLYSFDYLGSRSIFPFLSPTSPIPGGVCHANELILLFAMPSFTMDDQDKVVSSQMINLWANFVQHGNPSAMPVEGVPAWPAWTKERGEYLEINDAIVVKQDFIENEYFVAINENFPYV